MLLMRSVCYPKFGFCILRIRKGGEEAILAPRRSLLQHK